MTRKRRPRVRWAGASRPHLFRQRRRRSSRERRSSSASSASSAVAVGGTSARPDPAAVSGRGSRGVSIAHERNVFRMPLHRSAAFGASTMIYAPARSSFALRRSIPNPRLRKPVNAARVVWGSQPIAAASWSIVAPPSRRRRPTRAASFEPSRGTATAVGGATLPRPRHDLWFSSILRRQALARPWRRLRRLLLLRPRSHSTRWQSTLERKPLLSYRRAATRARPAWP